MQARADDHGRHEATAHRRRRFLAAEFDTILSLLAAVVILVVVVAGSLAKDDPAAAAAPPTACRRAVDAAERLVAAGEVRLVRDGGIDGRTLADPRLTSLYAAWRHEARACKAGS